MFKRKFRANGTCAIALVAVLISSAALADVVNDIERFANAEVDAVIETITTLARIDSASNSAEGRAQVADILDARLVDPGFATRRESSPASVKADSVVGVKTGTGIQNVMLITRMDTVYEAGISDSARVRLEAEKLYGPGVADNKGGFGVILHSLEVINNLALSSGEGSPEF